LVYDSGESNCNDEVFYQLKRKTIKRLLQLQLMLYYPKLKNFIFLLFVNVVVEMGVSKNVDGPVVLVVVVAATVVAAAPFLPLSIRPTHPSLSSIHVRFSHHPIPDICQPRTPVTGRRLHILV
jgi:hypothetical protein